MIPVKQPYRISQWRWSDFILNWKWFYKSMWFNWHMGIDFVWKNPWDLQDVYPYDIGKVMQCGYLTWRWNYIVIRHSNWYESIYAHLSRQNVKVGDVVWLDRVIAITWKSGNVTWVHLHYWYRPNKNHPDFNPNNGYKGWIDPTPYLFNQAQLNIEAQQAKELGLWSGGNPTQPATREEVAIISYRVYKKLSK